MKTKLSHSCLDDHYFYVSRQNLGTHTTLEPVIRGARETTAVRLSDTLSGALMINDENNQIGSAENPIEFFIYGTKEIPNDEHFVSNYEIISNGHDEAEITGEVRVDSPVEAEFLGRVVVDPKNYELLEYNPIYANTNSPIPCKMYKYAILP